MASKGRIQYDMLGIASVLKRLRFRVPVYQRAYAWGEVEIDDFWEDLRHAIDENEPDYFLGTLVLTEADDGRRATIIDGQQRLATTSLLVAGLRDVYRGREEDDVADELQRTYLSAFDMKTKEREPRVVLNEEDDPFFRELVVEKDGNPDVRRDSHRRLQYAYETLRGYIDEDIRAQGRGAEKRLVRWWEYLDDGAAVITVTVPTEADAFVIFETLNDRGAQLTLGDLLKNYLFMRAGEARLEAAKTYWIQALSSLELSAETDLFVTFVRHHWSSIYGATREHSLYSEIKKHIASAPQAVRYARQLADAAKLYKAIVEPGDDHWRQNGFSANTPTNVRVLLDLDLEQYRPLLLAVMTHFSVREQRKALQALVCWSVRGLVVGGIGGGRTERAYCEAAMKVRSGTIKTTAALRAELGPIIPPDADFEESFRRARQTKPRIARYLQLALERSERNENEPELVPNDNADQVNLEHVLPRSAKSVDWPAFSADEISHWIHRLGNHCLLKKSENGLIGNKTWAIKRPVLAASSLRLTAAAAAARDWDKDAIARRQHKLAKLAVRTWPR